MMRFFQAVSICTNMCCAGMEAGAFSLKKPHHIITLRFSEVVKDPGSCYIARLYRSIMGADD